MPPPDFVRASFWIDLGERTFRSFLQAFVGALGVGGVTTSGIAHPFMNLPWEFASEVGGVSAVLAFFTGMGAMSFGDKSTASFLPDDKQQAIHNMVTRLHP